MKIETKSQFYELYEKNAFGNKFRTWSSLNNLLNSNFNGSVSMRYMGVMGGGFCKYNVLVSDIQQIIKDLNLNVQLLKFNESAPDNNLKWQGELIRSFDHYFLTYSFEKCKMRDAMKNAKYMNGLSVVHLLKSTLTSNSYSDIEELFDKYEESVIELSVYNHNVGDMRYRNAIIWEVRDY